MSEWALGSTERPLRVAVVGSGPSGFYAIGALFKSDLVVEVDLFDRLPTPFGLVRGGVAPDHQKIKSVIRAYEKIAADVIARYRRLCGVPTHFVMGNDEHSQNVYQRAVELGLEPTVFCDQMEGVFREVWEKLDVSFDDFIRTTEDRHRRAVTTLVQKIADAGDLYDA